jgi:hypothetical protein
MLTNKENLKPFLETIFKIKTTTGRVIYIIVSTKGIGKLFLV